MIKADSRLRFKKLLIIKYVMRRRIKIKRRVHMTTLKFIFDKEKVAAAGKTEDELLAPMREHAAKYGIAEPEYGVFSKEGEDAMCVIMMFGPVMLKQNPEYIHYLEQWPLDVDGEKEDFKDSSFRWLKRNNMLEE